MDNPFLIPFIQHVDAHTSIENLSAMLDRHPRNAIQHAPWNNGAATPEVAFAIAHNAEAILLKYYVTEQEIKASYHEFNDPVYEDSCVEFFISFQDEPEYYNLEFNCAGTARVQFGPGKQDRVFIPASRLESIRYLVSIRNKSEASISWELTLYLPLLVFKFHPDLDLAQTPSRINLFKCGDGLRQPHFLCWRNIIAEKPDFHLPAFFKDAIFKKPEPHQENRTSEPFGTADITNKS